MCGVAGYQRTTGSERGATRLLAMLRAVRHRGPDDEGAAFIRADRAVQRFCTDESAPGVREPLLPAGGEVDPHRIALGQRRFSIIDLSPAGHQPYASGDGEITLVFNGEIYNYLEVRSELEAAGERFSTQSDTEVLLAAYRAWGVACFGRLNGFWAVALYDRRRDAVLLARDRIGKAPLYVTRRPEGVYWCSEIKGLVAALGAGAFTVNALAVDDFVRRGHRDVHHQTFYREIQTFPAAAYAWLQPDGTFEPQTYWTVPAQRRSERQISAGDAAAEMRRLLADAVRIRLRADVPVGLDLSGGLDSSSIVALAAAAPRSAPLRVFTVSYPGSAFDEAPFAQRVADCYAGQLRSTVLTPTNEGLLEHLDGFVAHMDEPFHDPQILNLRDIWRGMQAEGIRVSLNGAAGDELLAGYGSEYFKPFLRSLLRGGRVGRFAREFFSYTDYERLPLGRHYLRQAYHLLPDWMRLYRNRAMQTPPEADPYRAAAGMPAQRGPSRRIDRLLIDTMTHWRMNYWCRVGNHNSMGVPLEFRCPFLDYRLVEFAFTLPLTYLIRDGWLKWILRKAIEDVLPADIVWRRRKGGFRYPLGERLPAARGELLAMVAGAECPFIDERRLRDNFDEINRRDPNYLWRLLSVALWWKRCVRGEPLGSGAACASPRMALAGASGGS